MALAPDAAAINELVSTERDYTTLDPVAFRELQATFMGPLVPDTPAQFTLSTITLGTQRALRVRPANPSGSALLWIHGGGWVIGSAHLSLPEVYELSEALNCDVFTLEYRLAPESPFPAAYDDSLAAATDLLTRCEEFALDARKIAIGGDSAGGNLAAACALALTDRLCAQLLVYPATDLTRVSEAGRTYAEGYLLSTPLMEWFASQYATPVQRRDPRVSVALASDEELSLVAPAHVVIAEYDPLRDDGLEYAARLASVAVPVTVAHYDDVMHGFFGLQGVVATAHRAVSEAAAALRTYM